MRVIKKMGILLAVLWLLLVIGGNNMAFVGEAIWEIMNAFMPVVIVLIGIGLMIQSIFK
jgi:small neutral amino acid transporter SnatA (MarC family)